MGVVLNRPSDALVGEAVPELSELGGGGRADYTSAGPSSPRR